MSARARGKVISKKCCLSLLHSQDLQGSSLPRSILSREIRKWPECCDKENDGEREENEHPWRKDSESYMLALLVI